MESGDTEKSVKSDLDRCVKCGMCLPECPTYRLETNENESPRGRLALIEGLTSGRLRADSALIRHLDNCLACRRCERVCPSQVPYGRLIDAARERLFADRKPRLTDLIRNPTVLRAGIRIGRTVPEVLSRPFGTLHRMHEIARALPVTAAAPGPGDYVPDTGQTRGHIGLFTGCIGKVQQSGALVAALRLLLHAGYRVSVPKAAACCGALAQHAGDTADARRLATMNREAFGGELDAVVSLASGCGIHLDGYRPPLAAPHLDIVRFLLEHAGLCADDFAPLPVSAGLHTACSVENVYRGAQWARALLELIPELRLVAVGESGQCCGAAGDYMLRRPQTAASLRAPVIEQTIAGGHALLVTANVGCAMHLAAGMRERGGQIEVLHPVELLARQLLDHQR
jgi:glycolate oxidase iron-sulfur subunit